MVKILAELVDPVFRPLLNFYPIAAVIIVSFVVSVIVTLITKYTTKQDLMKSLKDDMKKLQQEMKTKKDKPDEMLKINKQLMDLNSQYMMQSFKSTLFTFLPLIIIFAWMNANLAYDPILPGQEFSATIQFNKDSFGDAQIEAPTGIEIIGPANQTVTNSQASFRMKGAEGEYIGGNALKFVYNGKTYYKELIITTEQKYAPIDTKIGKEGVIGIKLSNHKKIILPIINWGWLGSYILLSIVMTMLIRKVIKVY